MKAELCALYSTDVYSLDQWDPPDKDFVLQLRLLVGPEGIDSGESFDLTVCTGGWLAAEARKSRFVDTRHHLVVESFEWPAIRRFVELRVAACTGDTWEEIATQLARFAHWEFEDYTPYEAKTPERGGPF